jgi:hypothetical protein
MKKINLLVFACVVLMALPLVSNAAFDVRWGDVLSCTGSYLSNDSSHVDAAGNIIYCSSICDILATGKNILDFILTILLFILAPAYFLYGGFLIMTSGGSEAKWTQAKAVMRQTVIGILIILSSYLIVATFLWAVGNPAEGGVQWPNIACDPKNVPGGELNTDIYRATRSTDNLPATPTVKSSQCFVSYMGGRSVCYTGSSNCNGGTQCSGACTKFAKEGCEN